LLPAVDPMPTLLAPVVTAPSEFAPHAELRVPLVFASSELRPPAVLLIPLGCEAVTG